MVAFAQKFKFFFSILSYYSQNHASHFHTNFLSKEYFPIYVTFVIYSIVYIVQYVIYGFLWERIIFNVSLGVSFSVIIYLANKYAKYAQLLFTIIFMFGTILLEKLIISGLKHAEMFFLGIYVCIVYYNMIKGFNNILSNFAFFFMLMYFSGFFLTSDLEDLTTFFGNFTICFLQSYLTWTDYSHKLLEIGKQINEKKKWMHIFNKVFPGVTLLFKKKVFDHQNNSNNFKPTFKDLLQIEFVNIRGQERYQIGMNHDDIEHFLAKIIITTIQNQEKNFKNNETINIQDALKKKYSDTMFNLIDLIIDSSNENFNKICPENIVLGVYKENSKKMKISLANFEWNTDNLLLLHLDDENLEEEIKKLEENDVKKNELLASVTHDLRSPLNGMLAFINNAKNNENKNEREKMLHYAEVNGKLLMSLINDILDYSSFLNDKLNLIKESFHLDNLVTEVIDLMAVQASSKNIKLKVEKEFPENLHLFSDSRRIKQILINLIGNSIKFTMKGFVKLKVSQIKYKNILKFTIKDSGVGIKKETLDKLCTPYATFDTEKGLNKYGIGLGLNICKKLISLLGPNEIMNITSEYMVGTKISFFIFVDMNKQKNIFEKFQSTRRKKELELKKYYSSEIRFPLGPMLSNFPVKLTRNLTTIEFHNVFEKEKNSSISLSIANKKIKNFSEEISNLNCKFKSEKIELKKQNSKNKDFLIESQKLEFSPFGSISNNSDFEEKPFDNKIGRIIDFENKCSRAFPSNNDKGPLNFPQEKKSIFSPIKTFRILIADDNPFNILVITTYLKKIEKLKIYFDNACNGDEAVYKFKEQNEISSNRYYDVIFMDCLMPIKNGYEASLEIKTLVRGKQYHDTVIIAVTGLSGEEEEEKCLANGMDRFISKPISEKQCLDIINFYVEKRSLID